MTKSVNPMPTTPTISPLKELGSSAPFIADVRYKNDMGARLRNEKTRHRETQIRLEEAETKFEALVRFTALQDNVIPVQNTLFDAWKIDPKNRGRIDRKFIKTTQASRNDLTILRATSPALEDLVGYHKSDTGLGKTEEMKVWLGSDDDNEFWETDSGEILETWPGSKDDDKPSDT